MSKALKNYKKDRIVFLLCPDKDCNGIELPALLGEEDPLRPEFLSLGKLGRFNWESKKSAKIFHLNSNKPCSCNKCKTNFKFVAIISSGNKFRTPLIIGYNSDLV